MELQTTLPEIRLKKGKERSLLNRHPWVFSGAIALQDKDLEEGDPVYVNSSSGEYLATGHFHKGSITVRCFDFNKTELNTDFWFRKIENAFALRLKIGLANSSVTNCYRLIHGEGDGVPGLIVDLYGNTCVMQCHTLGMYRIRHEIAEGLMRLEGGKIIDAVYDKSAEVLIKQGIIDLENSYLIKKDQYKEPEFVLENGHKFIIDWKGGQKTGFFLDQRDNRKLLSRYVPGKNVLNTFCYTGGFSIYALSAGAHHVTSVDSSKKAMEGLAMHTNLNVLNENHEGVCSDVMDFLKSAPNTFDLLILDPPAYAKHINQVSQAMIGYRNLNTEGLRRIAKGGILFTFSCSQVIDRELFRKVVFQSALQAGRSVRILHQLSQPADHPISIYHPEAEYLKGLVLFVE